MRTARPVTVSWHNLVTTKQLHLLLQPLTHIQKKKFLQTDSYDIILSIIYFLDFSRRKKKQTKIRITMH